MATTEDLQDPDTAPLDVLLVDDAESLRTLYRVMIEDDVRFTVAGEAPDGRTAIDRAGTLQPDLVLLDLSMPDMDGLEALPKILDVAPDTTVIVLSGFLEDRFGDQARELGAAGYIEKGASPDEVLDEIVQVVGADRPVPEPPSPGPSPDPLREPLRDVEQQIDRVVDNWDPDLDGDLAEPLHEALEGTRRMESIIDGLLTYGRLARDGHGLEPVALDEALDAAIDRIADADAEIARGDLPVVHARHGQLVQLLEELLDNAIAFHHGTPTIEVTAETDGDRCTIAVADDGPGIPSDRRADALELFWTSRDDPDHHGLGLALCARIVERHGGELEIADAKAGGAKVTFTLDRAETEAS